VLRELALADASPRGCARGDELIRRRGRQDSQDGAPATAPNGGASPTEQHRLLPRYRTGDRTIEAGGDLFSIGWTGKSVFNLLDGWVAVYTLLEDGRRQIVQFALPGAILGILPSRRGPATVGAQALTDVTVSVIPIPVLTAHSRTEPEICLRMVRSLARDCSLAFDHLTSIGRRSARERVAHLLLELFTRYRAQWPGNHIEAMTLPLTQEQIGDATGLTFVHVNRVLSALRKEGIVQFHYRRLRILNPDRLIEVAGVDPETALGWLERRSWG
jgi:CRP/FNR family transcriptional regulator